MYKNIVFSSKEKYFNENSKKELKWTKAQFKTWMRSLTQKEITLLAQINCILTLSKLSFSYAPY